jgi:hypothetical protein
METLEEAADAIHREIVSDDSEVRAKYLDHFAQDIKRFSVEMARAVMAWRDVDAGIGDQARAYVSGLVHSAMTLHVISFKLLISGHMVPAGNVFRQVIESIALALLCSSKDLPVLQSFMKGQYSSKNAVRDVVRNWKKLGLIDGASDQLQRAQEFYGQYSHVTRLTLANLISFSEPGAYVGASFDAGKIDAYRKEVAGRVGLSEVFANIISAVRANVAKWEKP